MVKKELDGGCATAVASNHERSVSALRNKQELMREKPRETEVL